MNMSAIEKLRSFRVGPFAVFDFAASYTAAWYAAPYVDWYITRKQVMWLVIPTAIAVHRLIGIETPLNKMVLGSEPNRIAQAVAALMLYKGLVKS
jgi:hypothetical protein